MLVDDYLEILSKQPFFADDETKGSIRYHINWYQEKAIWRRIGYRATGTAALVLSICLPFIALILSDGYVVENKFVLKFTIPLLSLLIALCSGMNGFYQFNRSWQNYIIAMFNLETLLMEWELSIAGLRGNPSDDSIKRAIEITEIFVKKARDVITSETKLYFEEIRFPDIKGKNSGAV